MVLSFVFLRYKIQNGVVFKKQGVFADGSKTHFMD